MNKLIPILLAATASVAALPASAHTRWGASVSIGSPAPVIVEPRPYYDSGFVYDYGPVYDPPRTIYYYPPAYESFFFYSGGGGGGWHDRGWHDRDGRGDWHGDNGHDWHDNGHHDNRGGGGRGNGRRH